MNFQTVLLSRLLLATDKSSLHCFTRTKWLLVQALHTFAVVLNDKSKGPKSYIWSLNPSVQCSWNWSQIHNLFENLDPGCLWE